MVLQNYIELVEGVPTRLHFASHQFSDRAITDPLTRQAKSVRALVFIADQLNFTPVNATFSVVAEKLAQMLAPWLTDNRYLGVDFLITKRGSGFLTNYAVQVVQRGYSRSPP